MELMLLWLSTSITSICMEIVNELRMFKDVADAGYKIDIKRLSDLSKQLNPNAPKATLLSTLIPIFNIIQVFQRTIQYNNLRPTILDQLNTIDVLEEMLEIEKEEYSKNPTGLNAFIIPIKTEIRILNASKLTVEEQKEKIANGFRKMVLTGIEKYGDTESFVNALHNNTNLDLSHSSDDKKEEVVEPVQKLSINDQKQALENLKNKLLEEQQATQKSHTESEPVLTKKRK